MSNLKVLYPPSATVDHVDVFLAGTIEMGNSIDWQADVIKELEDFNIAIANPRRENFSDFSKEELHRQINWELDNLEKADTVFMYFAPGTISPISLLELGLLLGKKKHVILCCPDGYSRKYNVMVTCHNDWSFSANCDVYETLEEAVTGLKLQYLSNSVSFD